MDETEKIKVAVYARVSTSSEDQLNSLDNQMRYYSDYCRQAGYNLIEMYVDEMSGTNMVKRTGFQQMLHDSGINIITDEISTRYIVSDRKPKFNLIICKDISRFARSTRVIDVIDSLREKEVFIYFQNVGLNTKDANYRMMLQMLLNFSENESVDRSSKIRFGLRQRASEGKLHLTGKQLYGYSYDADTKQISTVNTEANVVKRVFDSYINQGLGSRQIANLLNNDGIPNSSGKRWTADAIVSMIRQIKYTGNAYLQMTSKGDVTKEQRTRKIKDVDEMIYHEGILPAIITTEIFNAAQEIMNSRSVNGRGKNNSKNIFSKKLVCGQCGKGYIKSSLSKNGRRYVFYACGQRRRLGTCQNKSIMLSRLETFIKPYCDGKMHEILNSKKTDLIKWIGYSISLLEDKLNRVDDNKQALRTRITEIEANVDTLIQQLIESSEQVKKAISRKIEQLEDERSKLETDLHSYDVVKIKAEINKLNETINNINKSSTQEVFTIEEVLTFVEFITIENEDLKIEFNFDKILPGKSTVKDTLIELLDKFKSASDEYKSILDKV